jgi:N-acetylmuramoyl-L-alanine amidase
MKVAIDAGHGGTDSGCRSVLDGTFESHYVLEVAKLIEAILAPYVDVVLTRKDDTFISLRERCRDANDQEVDLLVSLHTNSATTDAKGYEVFTSRGTTRADQLAKNLASRHVEAHPSQRNRGIKEAGFYILKFTRCPAALVEFGFFSNPTEAEWLTKESTKQSVANAVAMGILDFCGIAKQEDDVLTLEDRVARLEEHLGL